MSASTIVTRRNVALIASVAILLEAGEAIGLILLRERFDEIVDVAVHAPIQVREVVPEAPVSETILWEVVRPHLLRALAAPDLGVARGRLACRALLRGAREQPGAQDRHRLRLVLELAALVLAGDDLARGHVGDPHGRGGGVHALAGTHLDDDVLLVEGIARHELRAQTFGEVIGLRREKGGLLAGEVAQVGVITIDELLRLSEPLLGLAKRADGLDDRRKRRELLTDLADAVAVGRRFGIRDFSLELLITLFDALEPAAQSRREPVGHAAASASRSPAMASSSEATATSIIRSSGRRVVIPCSRRPGATSRRMSGDRSCDAPRRSASYEIDATGTTSKRRTTRSTSRLTRGRNAKITIDTTTTSRRNAVPQRGWAVGYGSIRSGVSGSPCSNAWIVMCSAP